MSAQASRPAAEMSAESSRTPAETRAPETASSDAAARPPVAAAHPEPAPAKASAPPAPPRAEPVAPPPAADAGAPAEDESPTVDLARMAWLATVLACLIAVTVLVIQGYVGYAGVTMAVAIAAAINLL